MDPWKNKVGAREPKNTRYSWTHHHSNTRYAPAQQPTRNGTPSRLDQRKVSSTQRCGTLSDEKYSMTPTEISGQETLMIDWSYHSIGLRGFHRWTDSERWFPSLGWASRMDFAHEQIEDTDHQRFTVQQVQLERNHRCQSGMSLRGSIRTTPWRTPLFFAPKTSLLHHITKRDHVWVSMIKRI